MINLVSTKLLGSKSIHDAILTAYRCPECGELTDSIFWGADELVRCYRCFRQSNNWKWSRENVKGRVAICASCDEEVSLTPVHMLPAGCYFCEVCWNIVGVSYCRRLLQPLEMLVPAWTPALMARSREMGNAHWTLCSNKRDHAVERILFQIASDEGTDGVCRGTEHKTMLCFNGTQYIGYLLWADSVDVPPRPMPVLRQLFIRPEFRDQGFEAALVRDWIEHIALRSAQCFGVERPDESMVKIIARLGHIYFDDKFIETKCHIFQEL